MAIRPVFVVAPDLRHCLRVNTEFEYFSGFSVKQQQRCIRSLHREFYKTHPGKKILEISSKSEDALGVRLSAFQLMTKTASGKPVSVESLFQAGKVFEYGGPYSDLLDLPAAFAKKDERLRNSGRIIGFEADGSSFPTEPKTLFYNWLYINALHRNSELAQQLMEYDAFTDIAFNPQKSINCQAEAAAIYVSLQKQGLLSEALRDADSFKRIVYP